MGAAGGADTIARSHGVSCFHARVPSTDAAVTGTNRSPAQVLESLRKAPGQKVKVAVADIDGVLRGKYLHKDKFFSAAESGGFGFCNVVFGWDSGDVCYDNGTYTG